MPKKWFLPTFIDLRQVEEDSVHHGIKLLEADTLDALQTSVNAFLILLESDALPPFYLDSIQVFSYEAAGSNDKFVAKIQLISLGEFELPP